jgi:hypothetical protein
VTALQRVAPAFVAMAHEIVWATAATVGADGVPRTRILHPLWQWDGERLTGWIATVPTPLKRGHIAAHPVVSLSYWSPSHDTCSAECRVRWVYDDAGRSTVWELFKNAPGPVGYDPAIIPQWRDGPTCEAFAAWRLTPLRLRVMPGTVLTQGRGDVLHWRA